MFILLLVLVFAPLVLSIVACVMATRARSELRELRRSLASPRGEEPAPTMTPPDTTPPPIPKQPAKKQVSQKTLSVPLTTRPKPAASKRPSLEVALGGKVASLIGVIALVLAVTFFVGYAIQHNLIGPGARIVLGLLAGGVLVALGHMAEVRSRNLQVLSRCLTGGGSALFYFCVFSAYSMYHLISGLWAGVGLMASAAAVFALSSVYNSQIIAVLGLVGAFIAPVLIGGEFDEGLFPLIFIAAVNVPVAILGLRRRWQVLYNLAFLITIVYMAAWIGREVSAATPSSWQLALGFSVIYFLQFVALGLVKLKREQQVSGRIVDLVRLLLSSLALLGATYWILTEAQLDSWKGATYLAIASLHVVLARIGWRWLPAYKDETLALLIGGLTFATLALPAQLDGVWVSLGWAMEGVILAWFALKVKSPHLQAAALAVGALGIMKSVGYDGTLYETTPELFKNGRFMVGLLSSALLGVQGFFHARMDAAPERQQAFPKADLMGCVAALSFVVVVFVDAFSILEHNEPWPWLISTMALLIVGAVLSTCANRESGLSGFGLLLLLAVPFKMLLLDLGCGWHYYDHHYEAFFNSILALRLIMIGAVVLLVVRYVNAETELKLVHLHNLINVVSVIAMMTVVSLEISRAHTPWGDSSITLFWSICAFVVGGVGLARRKLYLRYLALAIFGVSVLKVFFIDLSDLSGLPRIAAFFGLGVCLLVLSFGYQRIAPLLMGEGEEQDD